MPDIDSLRRASLSVVRLIRAACLACAAVPAAMAQGAAPNAQRIESLAREAYPQLDTLYKDIHAHPELGFQEVRTAGKLAEQMRALGFEVTEHVGRTGVVAVLRNGAGPTVLVRVQHRSCRRPACSSCGRNR